MSNKKHTKGDISRNENLPSIRNMHVLKTIENNSGGSLLEFENLKRNFGVGMDNNNANVTSLKSLRPEVFLLFYSIFSQKLDIQIKITAEEQKC